MSPTTVSTIARLARWLGPWTPAYRRPHDVRTHAIDLPCTAPDHRPMRAWIYSPIARPAVGSLLLVPGLHFAGPADPRLDRFARILASAGLTVLAPFLPDFVSMVLDPRVLEDTRRAWRALLELPDRPRGKPGVFSISFGSLPAIRLASHPEHAHELAALTLFGGYADLDDALRFCLRGLPARPHDPLNRPVIFLNLLEHMGLAQSDALAIAHAWKRYLTATWGRAELKSLERHHPIARSIANDLPLSLREVFLQTTGVLPGGEALFEHAVAQRGPTPAWLDPRPHLAAITSPTFVVHGATDDVIPHEHAAMLSQSLAPSARAGVHVTGLYGHTGSALPAHDSSLWSELVHMTGTLRAVAAAGGLT